MMRDLKIILIIIFSLQFLSISCCLAMLWGRTDDTMLLHAYATLALISLILLNHFRSRSLLSYNIRQRYIFGVCHRAVLFIVLVGAMFITYNMFAAVYAFALWKQPASVSISNLAIIDSTSDKNYDNPRRALIRSFYLWHTFCSVDDAETIYVETSKFSNYYDNFTVDLDVNIINSGLRGFGYRLRDNQCQPIEIIHIAENQIRFYVTPSKPGDMLIFLIRVRTNIGEVDKAIAQDLVRFSILSR